MAAHSSILAWRIPGMGEPGGCHLWGHTESETTEVTQQQQQELANKQNLFCFQGNMTLELNEIAIAAKGDSFPVEGVAF